MSQVVILPQVDYDGGGYTNEYLLFLVNTAVYTGKEVILTVSRYYQKRKGRQDRGSLSREVICRDAEGLCRRT